MNDQQIIDLLLDDIHTAFLEFMTGGRTEDNYMQFVKEHLQRAFEMGYKKGKQ